MPAKPYISLLELQQIVKDTIDSMPAAYWITAEIGQLTISAAGHCFLELVQHSAADAHLVAKANAAIWSGMYGAISEYFYDSTGMQLAAGIKIMVRVQVRYHALYSLQLNVIDIDPAYTAGEAAMQRSRTIARLRSEGILENNRCLQLPLLPQRIAVVSSLQSAGYQDFIKQIGSNPHGYRFHIALFAALVQGSGAEESITMALNSISERANEFDVVAILRGGGSQSDLSCFDSYTIAAQIAQFPLPIITGIGHDKDMSVADLAAYTMLKTPTAAAEFFIELFAVQERYLQQMEESVFNRWKHFLTLNKNSLMQHSLRINMLSSKKLNAEYEKISRYLPQRLHSAIERNIEHEKNKLQLLSGKLALLDPHSVLRRGYSITIVNGKTLHSAASAKSGDILKTIVADGEVHSVVME
jgi:exodeoxyribonuclease VII large subunit